MAIPYEDMEYYYGNRDDLKSVLASTLPGKSDDLFCELSQLPEGTKIPIIKALRQISGYLRLERDNEHENHTLVCGYMKSLRQHSLPIYGVVADITHRYLKHGYEVVSLVEGKEIPLVKGVELKLLTEQAPSDVVKSHFLTALSQTNTSLHYTDAARLLSVANGNTLMDVVSQIDDVAERDVRLHIAPLNGYDFIMYMPNESGGIRFAFNDIAKSIPLKDFCSIMEVVTAEHYVSDSDLSAEQKETLDIFHTIAQKYKGFSEPDIFETLDTVEKDEVFAK